MTQRKKGAAAASSARGEYAPIVTTNAKDLKSFDELSRPNAYLHDWTQLASKTVKPEKK